MCMAPFLTCRKSMCPVTEFSASSERSRMPCSVSRAAMSSCASHTGTSNPQPIGNVAFRPMEAGQEDAGGLSDGVGNDRTVGQFKVERRPDKFNRDLNQRQQLVSRQATMTVVHRLGQGIGDAGPDPDDRRLLDAKFHGDGVSGF